MTVDLEDGVAGAQAGLVRGRAGHDGGDHDLAADEGLMGQQEEDGEYDDGHDEVHHGACHQDGRALGDAEPGEALRVSGVVLSYHADEAAQREPVD